MKPLRLLALLSVLLSAVWALYPQAVRSQGLVFRGRQAEYYRGQPAVAGEVLVHLRPGASLASLRAAVDAEEDRPIGTQGWRRVRSRSRRIDTLMAVLAARGDVIEVEPNYIVEATATPNDPIFPWGMRSDGGGGIYAQTAWDLTTGSTATVVGVIDTGVEYLHPDLAANMWTAPADFTISVSGVPVTCSAGTHGFNAITGTCNPADDNGHGTHTSGTIGAVGNNGIGAVGVNWTTRIMALKFLDAGGRGSMSDAIAAIDFAIKAKAYFAPTKAANVRVLSNSWGGPDYVMALQQEIQAANSADMLFVAAAGNAASNNDSVPFYPASMNVPNVISVAATQGGDLLASFSNYGPNTVHLGAPGADVHSTYLNGQYAVSSGTSMATPHVAGAAALVLSGCNQTTAQLKATLLTTVDVVPALNGKVQTNGRLNVDRALRSCATLPVVTLTGPTEGAAYPALPAISLIASASDPDGIKRVEFYQGATLIGSVTTPPFNGTWSNVPNGNYTLTAVAFDTFDLRSVSSPVHITVGAGGGGGGPSAQFIGTDTTTQGSWRGVYGADGYQVVNDAVSYPAYATVTTTGAEPFTWASSTADVRGLEKANGSGRLAATWYGYGFTFDVNLTDGAAHKVGLYVVDWDNRGRAETVEIRDAVSGALLDSRTLSAFAGGQYWRWLLSGHVTIRVTVTNPPNAVVSGLFFDPPTASSAPVVSVTNPGDGATLTAPANLTVTATATDADGIDRVEFYQALAQGAPVLIGPAVRTPPYSLGWSGVAVGSYTLTAKAYDVLGNVATSAPVHITVGAGGGGGGPSAQFIGTDTTTQGSWRGVYGADGYQVVNDAVSYPAYATVTTTGAEPFTWASSTADVRGLEKANGSGRLAATWYGYGFTFDVNLTDGAAHKVGLYVVDWDNRGRAETVEIRDAVSGALLDSRTLSAFAGGQYWRWLLSGHVTIRVTVTNPPNAVVSGLFFDPPTASSAPVVSVTNPGDGATLTAPANLTVTATATDADGIDRVEFYQALAQGAPVLIGPAVRTPPYSLGWSGVAVGSYTLTAKAYDVLGNVATSAPVHITVGVGGGGPSAQFIGTDTTTQGSWRGVYGADGYQVVNDSFSVPAYAVVTTTGADAYTWASSTADVRGLEKANGSGRLAATWYGYGFTFDVNLTDGAAHQVSLYMVDWDNRGRAETVEIRDAVSGALLDSRAVSAFAGGQYWKWTLSGHVTVRVTMTNPPNAIVSGIFFR